MDMMKILECLSAGRVAAVIVLLLSGIQIAPIKINPWSWLAKHFGRAINGEVIQRQDAQQKAIAGILDEIDAMRKCDSRKRADDTRNRILRFDDELRRKIPHSKEFWEQTLTDCDWYEDYCQKNKKYVNSKCGLAIKNIREIYEEVKKNNEFI